jgi:hypothetical protein
MKNILTSMTSIKNRSYSVYSSTKTKQLAWPVKEIYIMASERNLHIFIKCLPECNKALQNR